MALSIMAMLWTEQVEDYGTQLGMSTYLMSIFSSNLLPESILAESCNIAIPWLPIASPTAKASRVGIGPMNFGRSDHDPKRDPAGLDTLEETRDGGC